MSTEPTKAELLQQMVALQAQVQAKEDAWQRLDREARAIHACVNALSQLVPQQRSHSYTLSTSSDPNVARVLRHLADRFGVQLVTERVVTQPCDRRHLDEATDDEVLARLRGWS